MAMELVAIKAQNEVEQEHQDTKCEETEENRMGRKFAPFFTQQCE